MVKVKNDKVGKMKSTIGYQQRTPKPKAVGKPSTTTSRSAEVKVVEQQPKFDTTRRLKVRGKMKTSTILRHRRHIKAQHLLQQQQNSQRQDDEAIVSPLTLPDDTTMSNNCIAPMPPPSPSKCTTRALTSAEVQALLASDDLPPSSSYASSSWVRRSTRQPSRSAISAPHVQALIDKLTINDPDMVVLKLKKYLSDPDTPSLIIDAMLDALERNTNCQALYIQVSAVSSYCLLHTVV